MPPTTNTRPVAATHSVWAEVDLDALSHNTGQVRALLSDAARIMAVVKADGYGCGAVEAARTLVEAGVDQLGVSVVEEAIALRDAGIETPVLCFAPLLPEQLQTALQHNVTVTVERAEQVTPLTDLARRLVRPVRCHLKVDTGMGRLGAFPEEALTLASTLSRTDRIAFEGVYTHFASAQERDGAATVEQWFRFRDLLAALENAGVRPPLAHCANSAALVRLPECHLDMVRPGTLLYGDWPAPFLAREGIELRSALQLRTRIVSIRDLPEGARVGYGQEWEAKRPSRIGVIPVGWADGLSMAPDARTATLSGAISKAAREVWRMRTGRHVLIGEARAPIIGRIGMQLTSIDLTDLPEVAVGDVVTVPCRKTAVPGRVSRCYRPLHR